MEKLFLNNDWNQTELKSFLEKVEEKSLSNNLDDKISKRLYNIVYINFQCVYSFGIPINEYKGNNFSTPFISVDFNSRTSINSSYVITNKVYTILKQLIDEIVEAKDFKEFRKSLLKKYIKLDKIYSKFERILIEYTDLYAKARRENINLEMEEVVEGYYNVKIEINIPK